MKTIGLIGGMSWESTALYYRLINERVRERLGGLHSARIILYSVDFEPIERLQAAGRWDQAGAMLADTARALAAAGADCVVLCTNTMHKVAPVIEATTDLAFLHIADATGAAVRRAGLEKLGLLGTRFTMEEAFYRQRLEERHAIEVLIPAPEDREVVHRVIYDELCQGQVRAESRQKFAHIMATLVDRGAQGIILGCTEIALLVDQRQAPVPLFDTTMLHARCAADYAMPDTAG